jgi:hypothetical protein
MGFRALKMKLLPNSMCEGDDYVSPFETVGEIVGGGSRNDGCFF